MGLAARAIEAAGKSTLTLSMLPAYTRAVGTPRVVGVDHPFNRPIGLVGDADGQRAVLRAALQSMALMEGPGAAVQLPFVWPEGRAQARGKLEPPPVAKLIQQKPWLLLKFMRGETGG